MGAISLKYKSKSGNLTAPGDVDPGAFIPIATTTVGVGGSATITFSSIPQEYEHLQIRVMCQINIGDADFGIRFNSDTGSNYTKHQVYTYGSGTPIATGTASTSSIPGGVSYSNTANTFGVAVIDILDYANTSKYKTTRVLTGSDANGSGFIFYRSGVWMNTNAISSISLIQTSGSSFQQYSSFALYGIKRAGA
jgi:hypothetical protein